MKFKSEERPSAHRAKRDTFFKSMQNPFEIDLINTEKNNDIRKRNPEERPSTVTTEKNPFLKLVKNPFETVLIDRENMDNNPFTRKIRSIPKEKEDASSRKRHEKSVANSETITKNDILEAMNGAVIAEITSKQFMPELKNIKNHFTKVEEKFTISSKEWNIAAQRSQSNKEEKEVILPQINNILTEETVPVKYDKVSNENSSFTEKDGAIRISRKSEMQENNSLNIKVQLDRKRISSKSSSHSSKNERIVIPRDISKRSAKKIGISAVQKPAILDGESSVRSDWFPNQESVCLLQDETDGKKYQKKGKLHKFNSCIFIKPFLGGGAILI